MQCSEKRQICLNYASNVPEWTLALQLEAVSALDKLARCSTALSEKFTGGLAYDKLHPDSSYCGEPQHHAVESCCAVADAMGEALAETEVLLTLAEQFGFASQLAGRVEAAYRTAQLNLESLCRRHGCPEVAYKHG